MKLFTVLAALAALLLGGCFSKEYATRETVVQPARVAPAPVVTVPAAPMAVPGPQGPPGPPGPPGDTTIIVPRQ